MQIGDYYAWSEYLKYNRGTPVRLGETYGNGLNDAANGGSLITMLFVFLIHTLSEMLYSEMHKDLFKLIDDMEPDDYLAVVMEVRLGGRFGKKVVSEPTYYIYKMNGM